MKTGPIRTGFTRAGNYRDVSPLPQPFSEKAVKKLDYAWRIMRSGTSPVAAIRVAVEPMTADLKRP